MNFAAKLIYELTISERDFRSDGIFRHVEFLQAIHVVASMAKQNKSDDDIIAYLAEFYALDLQDRPRFEQFRKRVKTD